MSTENNTQPSFLAQLGRFLLRLFFVVVIGIALGIGIYFGALLLFRTYVQPVQSYAARLDALESGQQQIEEMATSRFESLTGRVEALEIQGDTAKESLSALEGRLSAVESAQEEQAAEINALSAEMETLQTTVDELQTNQDELQAGFADVQQAVDDIGGLQADVEQALQANQENTDSIETLQLGLQEFVLGQGDLRAELQLLKAMDQLTRSRIFLTSGNVSQAQAEIRDVASMLSGLAEVVPEGQASYLEDVVTGLDESLSFLPRSPLQASDRLEGAWQMLLEGLPEEPSIETTAESTPTPTPTP